MIKFLNKIINNCLTVRFTNQAETYVGYIDPIFLRGFDIEQRIKGTPGITG
jgi:hypothetical protein